MSRRLLTIFALVQLIQTASAQSDFLDVNEETIVWRVKFSFLDDRRNRPLFTARELEDKVTTRAPNWQVRLRNTVGLGSLQAYTLDPIELQRDVVRLRTAYREAGYLHAEVDYTASVLDTTANTIDIQFSIRQGPPLVIQDVGFYTEAGYLAYAFEGEARNRWIAFRDETSFKTGDRFTYFEVVRIEDQVLGWLKNQGYAFPLLYTVLDVDSLYNVVDISFLVDPGPVGVVSSITIEGDRRVQDHVVRRALSFTEGDMFVNEQLIEVQRALFALNLFSVVQVGVPPQPRDSTVDVLITVQQARLRHISAQTGYHQHTGLTGRACSLSETFWVGGVN